LRRYNTLLHELISASIILRKALHKEQRLTIAMICHESKEHFEITEAGAARFGTNIQYPTRKELPAESGQPLERGSKFPRRQAGSGPAQKQLHILDADASRPAALRKLEISGIFLRFRAWPGGRLHTQICEFIFARTLSGMGVPPMKYFEITRARCPCHNLKVCQCIFVSVHGSRLTVEKRNLTMKIERFEDIEAWRLGRKLARKALKMS
jgi:hypothetical protein